MPAYTCRVVTGGEPPEHGSDAPVKSVLSILRPMASYSISSRSTGEMSSVVTAMSRFSASYSYFWPAAAPL